MNLGANSPPSSSSNRKLAIGAMAGGVANVIKALLQLMLLPVMARLLGPDEFGLYALAFPTIGLVTLLADGGLGSTLVREQETCSLVWSSAFWALQLTGLTLAVSVTAFGFFLGYVAQQPRLPSMIAMLSLSIIFLTLSVVPTARLVRRKRFGIAAGADLTSAIAGAMAAVTLALDGAGAWSLAVQYVVTYIVRAIILNLAAFEFPGAEFSLHTLRPHLVSGGMLIASRMCEYAGRGTENFLMDRIFGTALLGSYNFANQVSKFATDTASNVVWGALYVQALTEGKDQIIVLHRQLCRFLGLALFPITFLAAAAAPELISLLLGPKWTDLAFLFRIFLPLYALTAISVQAAPLLLAYGRFEIQFLCMLGVSVGRVLAVALGFWIGLRGAVFGVAFVTLFFCLAMLVIPAQVIGYRTIPLLRGLARPAASSLVAAGAFLLFNGTLATSTFPASMVRTLASLVGGFVIYAVCMLLVDRRNLMVDLNSARRLFSWRKSQ